MVEFISMGGLEWKVKFYKWMVYNGFMMVSMDGFHYIYITNKKCGEKGSVDVG